MASNVTTTTPQLYEYLNHVIFIFEGSGMTIGNLLIILTILLHKHLHRKELYLLVGLAVGDFLYGVGTLAAGILRLKLVLTHKDQVLITAWECMCYFQTIFFFIGGQTTAIMMSMLSMDRFFAVTFCSSYMKLTKSYAFMVLSGVGVHALISGAAAYLSSYFQTTHIKKYPSICISPWAVPDWYELYNLCLVSCSGYLSVALYLAVVVAYRRHNQNVQHREGSNAQAQQIKRQRRLTITLGIVTTCTFFFHSIPFTIILLMSLVKLKSSLFGILGPYTWVMVCVNSIINILIYILRHKDIREAMWGMIHCKKVTANVAPILEPTPARPLGSKRMEAKARILNQRSQQAQGSGCSRVPDEQM